LHSSLTPLLNSLSATGRLFPVFSVNMVTKRFSVLRDQAGINRQGAVLPSIRKLFVTECGRSAGTLHGIHRGSPVGSIREPDDLRHPSAHPVQVTSRSGKSLRRWGYRAATRPYPRHRRIRREAAIMQYDGGLSLSKA
jgi:hypothetical protein